MDDNRSAVSTDKAELHDNLPEEIEKMSQMIEEEKSKFEEQMARRKEEFDFEINSKIAELTAEKSKIDKEKQLFLNEKEGRWCQIKSEFLYLN